MLVATGKRLWPDISLPWSHVRERRSCSGNLRMCLASAATTVVVSFLGSLTSIVKRLWRSTSVAMCVSLAPVRRSEKLPSGRGVVADDLPDATSVVPPENPPKEPSKRRFEPADEHRLPWSARAQAFRADDFELIMLCRRLYDLGGLKQKSRWVPPPPHRAGSCRLPFPQS